MSNKREHYLSTKPITSGHERKTEGILRERGVSPNQFTKIPRLTSERKNTQSIKASNVPSRERPSSSGKFSRIPRNKEHPRQALIPADHDFLQLQNMPSHFSPTKLDFETHSTRYDQYESKDSIKQNTGNHSHDHVEYKNALSNGSHEKISHVIPIETPSGIVTKEVPKEKVIMRSSQGFMTHDRVIRDRGAEMCSIGEIVFINPDGTLDISYDDGAREWRVSVDKVKHFSDGPTKLVVRPATFSQDSDEEMVPPSFTIWNERYGCRDLPTKTRITRRTRNETRFGMITAIHDENGNTPSSNYPPWKLRYTVCYTDGGKEWNMPVWFLAPDTFNSHPIPVLNTAAELLESKSREEIHKRRVSFVDPKVEQTIPLPPDPHRDIHGSHFRPVGKRRPSLTGIESPLRDTNDQALSTDSNSQVEQQKLRKTLISLMVHIFKRARDRLLTRVWWKWIIHTKSEEEKIRVSALHNALEYKAKVQDKSITPNEKQKRKDSGASTEHVSSSKSPKSSKPRIRNQEKGKNNRYSPWGEKI